MRVARMSVLFAVFCSSSFAIFSRHLQAEGWGPFQMTAIRSLVAAILLFAVLRGRIFETGGWGRTLIANGVLLVVGSTNYAFSMTHASVGVVIAIGYLGPIWLLLWERVVRKQSQPGDMLACGLGFSGTLLVALPGGRAADPWGLASAFLGSFIYAASLLLMKGASKEVKPLVMTFWMHAVPAVLLAPVMLSVPMNGDTLAWGSAFGLVNGLGFFVFLFVALKHLRSSEVGILSYTELIFAWVIGSGYFGEPFSAFSLLGTLLIIAGGAVIARRPDPEVVPAAA